jgi:hypothetical protein
MPRGSTAATAVAHKTAITNGPMRRAISILFPHTMAIPTL